MTNPDLRLSNPDSVSYPSWNSIAIKDAVDIMKSGGTPKTTDPSFYDGSIPFLSISDVSKSRKYIFQTDKKISTEGLESCSAWLVPSGTLIVSMYASYGKPCINLVDLATSQALIAIKLKQGHSTEFFYYLFEHLLFSRFWDKFVKTGTQANLSKKVISSAIVQVPSKEEQSRIGDFFSNLDEKISVTEKALCSIRLLKKGLLQRILSKEIRFKNDNGESFPDWTSVSLDKFCVVNPKSTSLPENFLYIDLESVSQGHLIKRNVISREVAPSRAQRVLSNKDVLFQTVRPYQQNNLFYRSDSDEGAVASTGYAQLRCETNNPYFLYTVIHSEDFSLEVQKKCTGGAYPAIKPTMLSKIHVPCPVIEEQEKIANLFFSIDEKIEINTRKLDALRSLKKGFMQKMFI